jgi:hypothetical protein
VGDREKRGNNKRTEYLTGKLDGMRPLSCGKMRKANRAASGPVGDSGSYKGGAKQPREKAARKNVMRSKRDSDEYMQWGRLQGTRFQEAYRGTLLP